MFYWIGKPANEHRQSGVGFAIRKSLADKLDSVPKGINDRLMVLRVPISSNQHLTIVSAYAPTMTNQEDVEEKFFEDLKSLINSPPPKDKLIIMGDFNARVGRSHENWKRVIGRHGTGKENSNGTLLLSLCAQYQLAITNTVFQLLDKHKTSWMHPRSEHWHLIDYVIV